MNLLAVYYQLHNHEYKQAWGLFIWELWELGSKGNEQDNWEKINNEHWQRRERQALSSSTRAQRWVNDHI